MVKTLAIIQARISSSRLPAKVMLDLAGQPVLARVIESVQQATVIDQLVVATSTETTDDMIADWCQHSGVACYRGALDNVQQRFYQVARQFDTAQTIIRITADNPLTSGKLIDYLYQQWQEAGMAYGVCAGAPVGASAEVFTAAALKARQAAKIVLEEQEHVTVWMREHLPAKRFPVPAEFRGEALSATLDTLDDYVRLQRYFSSCHRSGDKPSIEHFIQTYSTRQQAIGGYSC